MIRLTRPGHPKKLTPDYQKEKTAEFKAFGNSVWNCDFIRSPLREMSHGKCAFCECKLEEESKYLEVEHFAHKNKYPDRVMMWANFLPACRRCNGKKSTHDTILTPIINPADEDPRDSLRFRNYRFEGSNSKGCATVEVLDLNDYERLMLSRFKIGSKVLDQLSDLARTIQTFTPDPSDVRASNRVVRKLKSLLDEGQPSAEYAATVATVMIYSGNYATVKSELERHCLWSAELDYLDRSMRSIAYPDC